MEMEASSVPYCFKLYPDVRSASFIYDDKKCTKIKNAKINEWRKELGELSFDIEYQPRRNNVAASLNCQTSVRVKLNCQTSVRVELNEKQCHSGVSRLLHFVQSRNFPFSIENVKKTCASCRICAELKPQFNRPTEHTLIKATGPM